MKELNDHGLLIFKHKTNKRLFLYRPYRWVDRLTLLDETEGRQVIDTYKFSTYDFGAWESINKEEYSKIERSYKDIYS